MQTSQPRLTKSSLPSWRHQGAADATAESSFTHTPSGQSSAVEAGDKEIRFILNDQRIRSSQPRLTKSSLPRGQHHGAADASADRLREIRPEFVLARDLPNLGGDEGRIYGENEVEVKLGSLVWTKRCFNHSKSIFTPRTSRTKNKFKAKSSKRWPILNNCLKGSMLLSGR